ncbi:MULTISPECIES: condensation domain-containing protein [unclassified Listeria]|uniref:condensation domain-containing protein n=1 Tax=unclassified Listeria TaxID=2642072 RepID=UPI000B58BBD7|nr:MULTISPECIES: condensation domain-containing protein [unclassified Listeria]
MPHYKAESSDIKHLISSENHKNDHHLHAYLEVEGHLDLMLLEKTIRLLGNKLPHLFCKFQQTKTSAKWVEADFSAQNFISLIETEDSNPVIQQALTKKLNILTGPQIRVTVIRTSQKDNLVVILNHMLADGAGFKQLLYLLAEFYTKLVQNPDFTIKKEAPSRSLNQVFQNFSLAQKWHFLTDKITPSPSKNPNYPLKGDDSHPYILRVKVSNESFSWLKAYAKNHGVTINDCLVTAFSIALHNKLHTAELDIDCPIDLRKFTKKTPDITNLTANLTFSFRGSDFESLETTLLKKKEIFKAKKSDLQPLHKFYLLELIYKFLPYRVFKKQVQKRYNIPQTSLTNMGIIDDKLLDFGGITVSDVFISGSLKFAPYFQVAVTTFRGELSLSTNLHGTEEDYRFQLAILEELKAVLPHK